MSSRWRDLARRALGAAVLRRPTAGRSTPPRSADGPGRGTGGRHLEYSPQLDGRADPGEVVWTWVPFEEDASQGKDRPLLVVGRDGTRLLGLMLSSQDYHRGDPAWLGLGAGAWDGEHRPSWVRLDRLIDVQEDGIRREGAILDRTRFDTVATALRRDHGWS